MKFSVDVSEFKNAVSKILPAIPSKSTLPVLEHFYAKLEGDILTLISTDQDLTILSTLKVTGSEEGKVLLPARKISEFLKVPGMLGELNISVDMDLYNVSITSTTGSYQMKGLDVDQYLKLPELEETSKPSWNGDSFDGDYNEDFSPAFINRESLVRLCQKTHFAVSSDEFRPSMTGVLFQFKGEILNVVATDSYRLVKAKYSPLNANLPKDLSIIIPIKTIDLLKNIDNDVLLSFLVAKDKVTHCRFDIGDTVIISKVITEKFPPYESVIPSANPSLAVFDREELISAIKRVSFFSNSVSKQLKIKFTENKTIITGNDEESGMSGTETLNCKYAGNEVEIGFNFKFLEDAINNIDKSEENLVYITFSEPLKPILVLPDETGDELLNLIMPVKIK